MIDTAGIIKQRKVANKLQERSIEQSIESLKKSHIVLLVIDAVEPITVQDKNLAREILDVVDQADFLADKLRQPNGRAVSNAKVEGRVSFKKGLKGRTFISVLPVLEAAE